MHLVLQFLSGQSQIFTQSSQMGETQSNVPDFLISVQKNLDRLLNVKFAKQFLGPKFKNLVHKV